MQASNRQAPPSPELMTQSVVRAQVGPQPSAENRSLLAYLAFEQGFLDAAPLALEAYLAHQQALSNQ